MGYPSLRRRQRRFSRLSAPRARELYCTKFATSREIYCSKNERKRGRERKGEREGGVDIASAGRTLTAELGIEPFTSEVEIEPLTATLGIETLRARQRLQRSILAADLLEERASSTLPPVKKGMIRCFHKNNSQCVCKTESQFR